MIDTLLDWTHVIAGVAWIGSSFYFIALDAGLQPNTRLDPRVKGEAWQVHSGGFYQIQKFAVAPEVVALPTLGAVGFGMLGQSAGLVADAGAPPVSFADVKQIVDQRCHICHSAKPKFPGFAEAPKGVMFDTPAQIKRQAPQIMAQAVKTHTTPLGNVTEITDSERSTLGIWVISGSKLD